jgi:hypothetical protein
VGNSRERGNLEDLSMDGRMILKLFFKKWNGWVWTGLILAQGRDLWWASANMVMYLWVS